MKIAVVCGGLSNERDVSITSGTCVARALREHGHKVVLVDLYCSYAGDYDDPAELFEREQEDLRYSVKEEAPDIRKADCRGRRKQDRQKRHRDLQGSGYQLSRFARRGRRER